MKKIIHGKQYDTAVANLVGFVDNGRAQADPAYVSEALYRKRTWEYFLHIIGGPASVYAVRAADSSWSGSERIVPLPTEAASQWAKDHLSHDVYEAEFVEFGTKNRPTSAMLRLQASTLAALRREAVAADESVNECVDRLIRSALGLDS